jgi:hypothetical protein
VAQALDYASCLFEMDYAELEAAVRRGSYAEGEASKRLYERVQAREARDEAQFVDAVNTNLRMGRILILVAGDGIRTEAERLVESLQSHAGFHFTLALVELAVFRLPEGGSLVVHPRTLAQTCMIDRGVVTIDDRRTSIRATAIAEPGPGLSKRRVNITAEQFHDAMEKLEAGLSDRIRVFLADLEALGVYPDYQRSLNLKWDPAEGKPVNLGYILRNGQVWTDASNWFVPLDLSHRYNEELADALGMAVEKKVRGDAWCIQKDGKAPTIVQIADRFGAWKKVIEKFLDRVSRRVAQIDTD